MTSSDKSWGYVDEFAPMAIAVDDYCSSVSGGTPWQSGNSISNFDYVGIFGCNVLAARDEAFHANNYVIQDIRTTTIIPGNLTYTPGVCSINIF